MNGGSIAVFTVLSFLAGLTLLGNVEIQSKRRTTYLEYKRGKDCTIKIQTRACYDFSKKPIDPSNLDCPEVVSVSEGCLK